MSNLTPQGAEIVGSNGDTTGGIITTTITGLTNLAASIFGTKSSGSPDRPPKEPMPAWIMPTAIGGIGVIALAIYAGGKKKR